MLSSRLRTGSSGELAEVMLLVDAQLLIHDQAEAELSGATCAVLRLEGLDRASKRLSLVHLGDCGVVLGRRKKNGLESEPGAPRDVETASKRGVSRLFQCFS